MKRLLIALLLFSSCSKKSSEPPTHNLTLTFDDGLVQTMQVADRISQLDHNFANGPVLEMWHFKYLGGNDNSPNGGAAPDGNTLSFAAPTLVCNNQYFDSTNFYTQQFRLRFNNQSFYANALTITEAISEQSPANGSFVIKASLSSEVTNSYGNSQRGVPLNKSVTVTGQVGDLHLN